MYIYYVYVYDICVARGGLVDRIHILVDEVEKARYRRQAEREGKSLGAWLRTAAREKLQVAESQMRIETPDELSRFFEACDAREQRPEPDWAEHRRVIDRSRIAGLDAT